MLGSFYLGSGYLGQADELTIVNPAIRMLFADVRLEPRIGATLSLAASMNISAMTLEVELMGQPDLAD